MILYERNDNFNNLKRNIIDSNTYEILNMRTTNSFVTYCT